MKFPLPQHAHKLLTDDSDGQGQSSQRKNALTLIDPGFSNFQRGARATRVKRHTLPLSTTPFSLSLSSLPASPSPSKRMLFQIYTLFYYFVQSFRDKVKSSLQKSVKKNSKQENLSGGGSVRVGRSKSFGKSDRIEL